MPADDDDENFDDDLPPLVPSEEAVLPQLNLEARIEIPPEASNHEEERRSRPPRQLRSRSVARSVVKDRRVQFSEKTDCVEQDHQYQEPTNFEKEGTLFPPFEFQGDVDYLSRKNGNSEMIPLLLEH